MLLMELNISQFLQALVFAGSLIGLYIKSRLDAQSLSIKHNYNEKLIQENKEEIKILTSLQNQIIRDYEVMANKLQQTEINLNAIQKDIKLMLDEVNKISRQLAGCQGNCKGT